MLQCTFVARILKQTKAQRKTSKGNTVFTWVWLELELPFTPSTSSKELKSTYTYKYLFEIKMQ
jgi:hypothetical protein